MNMREVTSEYRLAHWAQIVKDRAESGESIRGYCQNRGIKRNVYFYWQRKLREASREHHQDKQGRSRSLVVPGFAEVKVETEPTVPIEAPVPGQICIEANGLRINADSTYPTEQLLELVRVLRQC